MKMHKKLLPPELLLLAQICTKSFVGWGFAPDPTGRAYSAPPDLLPGLGSGAPGKREGRREGEKEGRGGGGGMGGEGRGWSAGMPKSRVSNPIRVSLRGINAYGTEPQGRTGSQGQN